jgi:rare lipoprotein A
VVRVARLLIPAKTVVLLLGGVMTLACASGRGAAGPAGSAARPPLTRQPTENGLASWYGEPYHGRMTSSGAVFDMQDLTAAHRTLPFGTRLRVTRKDTGKSVDVVVNDRGPFVADRILDLSFGAAKVLDMVEAGARARRPTARLSGEPARRPAGPGHWHHAG